MVSHLLSRLANLQQRNPVPLMLFTCCLATGCGSRGEKMDIVERFDGNSFDRDSWEIVQPEEAIGKVEIKNDALLFTIPPSPEPRPQIRNNGKFWFDGDFEVQMDFELIDPLPEPTKDYTNVELIVFGADGSAHLSRTNHHGAGNGFVSYFASKVDTLDGHWQHTPSDSESGTLKIRRTEDRVEYLFEKDGSSSVVGTSDFGLAPVTGIGVALSVSTPTTKPFQVRLDNLAVHTTPRPLSIFIGSIGKWIAAAVVVFLILLGGWLYRSGDSTKTPNGPLETDVESSQPKPTATSAGSLDDFNVS